MATLVLIVGLVLAGILAVLAVIAFVQPRSRPPTQVDTRTTTRQRDPTQTRAQSTDAIGQEAEAFVQHERLARLPNPPYTTYHSLYIPHDRDPQQATEIDHVVVSPFGVFAIETKSWQGTITGGPHDSKWTLEQGGVPRPRTNPVTQNKLHVRSLFKYLDLGESSVISVVCFHGNNWVFGNSMPDNVVSDADLNTYITNHTTEKLNAEAVSRANRILTEHIAGPIQKRYRAIHEAQTEVWRQESDD